MPGHSQFWGAEHPKRLPYSHHGFQFYPPGHCRPRHSHFLSAQRPTERRYRLELSDDPGGLRPLVPPHPGFPSEAHDGFPPCRRPPARHTFDNPLPPVERTGHRFSHLTGSPLAETGRVAVSASPIFILKCQRADWIERRSFTPERPLQPDEPD